MYIYSQDNNKFFSENTKGTIVKKHIAIALLLTSATLLSMQHIDKDINVKQDNKTTAKQREPPTGRPRELLLQRHRHPD